jgi:hypothetical protein
MANKDPLDTEGVFYFTMTPVPNFAGLQSSNIFIIYQLLRLTQYMPVFSGA